MLGKKMGTILMTVSFKMLKWAFFNILFTKADEICMVVNSGKQSPNRKKLKVI